MTDDTQASAIPPQPQIAPAPAQALNGIGGWLILPMLGLFASIILQGLNLPDMFQAFAALPAMTDGTQANLISGDLILAIILSIVIPVILLVLMFGRSRKFPRYYIMWAIAAAIFAMLDLALGYMFSHDALEAEGTSFFNYDTLRTILSALIGVCIWVPYMLNSVRVKNTFVK